jgi:hypothetical protein
MLLLEKLLLQVYAILGFWKVADKVGRVLGRRMLIDENIPRKRYEDGIERENIISP